MITKIIANSSLKNYTNKMQLPGPGFREHMRFLWVLLLSQQPQKSIMCILSKADYSTLFFVNAVLPWNQGVSV